MAAARALGLYAGEKARAAAGLGPSLQSMLLRGACPRAHLTARSPFSPRASQLLPASPRVPSLSPPCSPMRVPCSSARMRVPALLPMPRVPELISMPRRTAGAIHFGRVAFSTAGKSKEAAFAGIADEKDISRIVAALQAAAAEGGDADLFKRLTKFIEDHGMRQQVIERVARRNQTVMILGGVLVEIVVIVLGSVVFLGPVVFDYVKGRVHEMIREEDAKVSIWHTIDNAFGYFGNKIASPFIVFARGVAVAGNQVRRAGRKVGVLLYVMKEKEVIVEVPAANTPQDKEPAFKRFFKFFSLWPMLDPIFSVAFYTPIISRV